jgi:UDP-glucose 4-epimerase
VWDADVSGCLVQGALGEQTGTYNLTGDGVMTLREIAAGMRRPYVALPERLVARALEALHKRKLSPYGPEQTVFLRYRPVMSNERLKRDFGYTPRKTSREVFELYRQSRG